MAQETKNTNKAYPVRYGRDLGCLYGAPHNMRWLADTKVAKWEKCVICGRRFRWTKGPRGRVDNAEYLKAHIRQFAQRGGATKRVYHQIYRPEEIAIIV